jgi:hypothetical protein
MSQPNEAKWLKQINAQLDNSTEQLDYPTQLKLKQARHRAINQNIRSNKLFRWLKWGLPTMATATVAAILTVNALMAPNENQVPEPNLFQDLEILAMEEDMELIKQLEFYEWLENNAESELES